MLFAPYIADIGAIFEHIFRHERQFEFAPQTPNPNTLLKRDIHDRQLRPNEPATHKPAPLLKQLTQDRQLLAHIPAPPAINPFVMKLKPEHMLLAIPI